MGPSWYSFQCPSPAFLLLPADTGLVVQEQVFWGEGDGGKQDQVGMVSPLESAAGWSPGELWTLNCTAELSLFKTRRLTFLIPVSVNHQLVGCLAPGIVQGSGVISQLRLQ